MTHNHSLHNVTSNASFIAGDWGTTHLRLSLCSASAVLDQRNGPGIAELQASPEASLFELIDPWTNEHGKLPVWLCGMVGSRNGWREAPYVPCPADIVALGESTLRFSARHHDITIVSGVSCANPHGAPDVMRGEETQILGMLAAEPELGRGARMVALPGTHTKWALIEDACLVSFQTSMVGELYRLLCERSTLTSAPPSAGPAGRSARPAGTAAGDDPFELGVRRSRELAGVPLTQLLFEVRSRQLLEGLSADAARPFLSGLLIGQDVLGALPLFDRVLESADAVPVIGAPELANLYQRALAMHGINAQPLDASELTLAGLSALARLQGGQETAHDAPA